MGAIVGGLDYQLSEDNIPVNIENSAFYLTPGHPLEKVYSKILLPNYDIFDERKYYTSGTELKLLQFGDKTVALLICEDMWPSLGYRRNPVEELYAKINGENRKIDLIVNISASPYFLGKQGTRFTLASQVSRYLQAPLAYVNRVGGEDEILFDGGSFLVNGEDKVLQARQYVSETLTAPLPAFPTQSQQALPPLKESTWESLFTPSLISTPSSPHALLAPLSPEECESCVKSISFGLQEYARKNGFDHFLVGLSGGIDSALVLALLAQSLRDNQSLEALFLPSHYSSNESAQLAQKMSQNLGVPLHHYPIDALHASARDIYRNSLGQDLAGVADENIQSRLRGALLYAHSNQTGRMVINTSNKSELAVGYSTLYGDSVGALSIIGDLYKGQVYQLARYVNDTYNGVIPEEIITRPPTAELRENQKDEDGLPPYERLDPLLEGILSYRMGMAELTAMGFDPSEIEKVYGLYKRSEYKRKQFGPIIKLQSKSFGIGHRIPMTDRWRLRPSSE